MPDSAPRNKSKRTDAIWLSLLVLLLACHFWQPRLGPGVDHSTYSAGAFGKKAFFLLTRAQWPEARRLTTNLRQVTDSVWAWDDEIDTTLCILGPQRYPSPVEWKSLLQWVDSGGSLVFAARFDLADVDIPALDVAITSFEDDADVEEFDEEAETDGETAPQADTRPVRTKLIQDANLTWKSTASITAPDAEVLIQHADTVQAVGIDHGNGRIIVLASPFLFTNQSLAWGENSVLATRIVENAGSDQYEIVFDESLNRSGTPKAVGLLLEPTIWPISTQLLILILLFAWWNGRRFGPRLPPTGRSQQDIVDHTDTAGALYYRSRNSAAVLAAYLRQFFAQLHLRHFRGREEQVLAPIARRMNKDVEELKKLLTEAARTAKNPRAGRREVAALIRRLSEVRAAARR